MSIRLASTLFLSIVLVAAIPASATVVTTLAEPCPDATTDPFVWCKPFITGAGEATIDDLTGLGGDLENNQPLPTGAVRLETTTDNNDRANIGLLGNYGAPGDIFPSISLSYSYHKASNGAQNLFAAPALKLAIFSSTCDFSGGDCFGQLIYEPNWNQPGFEGSSTAPPLDSWEDINLDGDTGLFWWTGGFGQPSGAGGPPLRTLNEWLTFFSQDIDTALVVGLEIGVGSFNQLQLGYVDDVEISHGSGAGLDLDYDFEPPQVPISGPVGVAVLGGLLALGLAVFAVRRRVTA